MCTYIHIIDIKSTFKPSKASSIPRLLNTTTIQGLFTQYLFHSEVLSLEFVFKKTNLRNIDDYEEFKKKSTKFLQRI